MPDCVEHRNRGAPFRCGERGRAVPGEDNGPWPQIGVHVRNNLEGCGVNGYNFAVALAGDVNDFAVRGTVTPSGSLPAGTIQVTLPVETSTTVTSAVSSFEIKSVLHQATSRKFRDPGCWEACPRA